MDVNDQLARGRPFFADIARDGIALYEAPGQGLAMPRQLDAQERHAAALRHRAHWFPLAAHALQPAQDSLPDGVDRKDVGEGTDAAVSVKLAGRRHLKKK